MLGTRLGMPSSLLGRTFQISPQRPAVRTREIINRMTSQKSSRDNTVLYCTYVRRLYSISTCFPSTCHITLSSLWCMYTVFHPPISDHKKPTTFVCCRTTSNVVSLLNNHATLRVSFFAHVGVGIRSLISQE